MKWIDNLKTSVKLFSGFGVVVVLLLVIAGVSYTSMNNINNLMATMYADRLLPIEQLGAIKADLSEIRGNVYKGLLIPAELAKFEEDIPGLEKEIDENLKAYKATYLLDSEKAELAVFEPAWSEYQAALSETLTLIKPVIRSRPLPAW